MIELLTRLLAVAAFGGLCLASFAQHRGHRLLARGGWAATAISMLTAARVQGHHSLGWALTFAAGGCCATFLLFGYLLWWLQR